MGTRRAQELYEKRPVSEKGRGTRLVFAGTLGVALLLILASPALAKMWVRTSLDPPTPQVGGNTHVTALTFYLTSNHCWDDPAASPIPHATWYGGATVGPDQRALELRASGPASSDLVIPLMQRASDPAYWDGAVVFPAAGEWTLRVVRAGDILRAADERYNQAGNRCAGFERTVTVLPSDPSSVLEDPGGAAGSDAPSTKLASHGAGPRSVAALLLAAALLGLAGLLARDLVRHH